MKKIFLLVFALLAAIAPLLANNFIIGTGSGTLTLTAQGAHSPGDTCYITGGSYSSANFSNLNGIIFLPLAPATRINMTGQMVFNSNKYVEVGFISWVGYTNGDGCINSGANSSNNCYFHNLSFTDISGPAMLAGGNRTYTVGDTTSFLFYKCRYDSITSLRTTTIYFGGYGTLDNHADQCDSIIWSRVLVLSPTSNAQSQGCHLRYPGCFRLNVHDMIVCANNTVLDGDVGTIYNRGGNGNVYNVYIYGQSGYITRWYNAQETAHPRSINVWNCAAFNKYGYGAVSVQYDPGVAATGIDDCNVYIYNITLGNCTETNNYQTSILTNGGHLAGYQTHLKNSVAFNNVNPTGKDPILTEQGNIATDVSNCAYYTTSTLAGLDNSTTFISNSAGNFPGYRPLAGSPVLSQGIVNPFSGVDYSGNTRPTNGDLGYLQFVSGAPPANQPPVARITGTNAITLPTNSTTLSGVTSSDPDGSIASFAWSKISGGAATIATPTAATTNITGLVAGTYVFQLIVTDNLGLTNSKQYTVTVNSVAGSHTHIWSPGSQSFTGVLAGDTILMNAGTYASINLSGKSNLVFLNNTTQGEQVVLAGNLNMGNTANIRFRGWNLPAGAFAYQMNGTDFGMIDAQGGNNVGDTVESFHTFASYTCLVKNDGNDLVYAGTPATAGFWGLTVNNFLITGSKTMVYQGTYDYPQNLHRYNIGFTVSNFEIVNDATGQYNNVKWRGFNTYGFHYFNGYVHGPTYNLYDAGMIWVDGGSGRIDHINKQQGWAYLCRWWVVDLAGIPFDQSDVFLYNMNCFNTHYGGIDVRSGYEDGYLNASATYARTFTQFTIDHFTTGNNDDTNPNGTYFSPAVILGGLEKADGTFGTLHLHNTFAYNASARNASKLATSLLGRNSTANVLDSSNNIDFKPTQLLPAGWVVDQVGNIPVVGGGLYHRATDGTDIGYAQTGSQANTPPTSIITGTTTIQLPTSGTTLSGASSTDIDGVISGYLWQQVSGPATATLSSATAVNCNFTGLTAAGNYQFSLRVTDNGGATNTSIVTVVVKPANVPPNAVITGATAVQLPASTITLSGTASNDPDGSVSAYLWTQVSGTSTATNSTPTAATTTFGSLAAGTYVFNLKVTDNQSAIGNAQQTVVVSAANTPPTAVITGPTTITLPTNTFFLSGTGSNDANGSIVSYAWTKVSGPGGDAIATPTANATNITVSSYGTYVYQLTVTDNGGLTGTSQKTVIVNQAANINPNSVITGPASVTLPINTVTLSGVSSNDPDGSVVAFSWMVVTAPGPVTTSPSTASTFTLSNMPVGAYTISLQVTDDRGGTGTFQKIINVYPSTIPVGQNYIVKPKGLRIYVKTVSP